MGVDELVVVVCVYVVEEVSVCAVDVAWYLRAKAVQIGEWVLKSGFGLRHAMRKKASDLVSEAKEKEREKERERERRRKKEAISNF